MQRISTTVLNRIKAVLSDDVQDTFSQDEIIWKRIQSPLNKWGEDNTDETFVDVPLKGQFAYNYFRQWNILGGQLIGEKDPGTQAAIFVIKYLKGLGYTDANNNFIFDPGRDRFMHRGREYKCGGYTFLSQVQDEPMYIMIVFQREELNTGAPINELPSG